MTRIEPTTTTEGLVRRIAALALPALGVLAAEPLYLLFDTAVIGRLGALSLAGLSIGGLVVTMVSSQLTFLSYGTTARSARFHGAGDRSAAVREGVQATWLALILGVLIVVAVQAVSLVRVICTGCRSGCTTISVSADCVQHMSSTMLLVMLVTAR